MKKLLLTLASLAIVSFASNAQLQFAPMGGVNFSNVSYKFDGTEVSSSMRVGGHIGLMFNYGFTDKFSIMPGILFSMKGANDLDFGLFKANLSMNYIEVPINAVYTLPIGIMFNAGPYIGYALGGKMKVGEVEENVEFTDGGLERMDFGLNGGIGYKMPMGLFFRAQYGYGLANYSDGPEETLKNTCIGISVGYFIGGNR